MGAQEEQANKRGYLLSNVKYLKVIKALQLLVAGDTAAEQKNTPSND